MGLFDRDNKQEGKDAISRGDVSEAMASADRDKTDRETKESLSSDRQHGGLDSFKSS